MNNVGAILSILVKEYWDVLCAIVIFIIFITKMKTSVDFLKNRIDYEIARLREYVDVKNDNLYEKIADIKRSIDAVGVFLHETATQNKDELREISKRMDKFFDSRL